MKSIPLILPLMALPISGQAEKRGNVEMPQCPNVVFIYADDIGYGDLSCNGSKTINTPNVQRMATEGVRFTNAHSAAATSTPSRYAMLTGEYAWRREGTGIADGDAGMIIRPERYTLADMFRDAGYATGVVGKWHLGLGDEKGTQDWNQRLSPNPADIGFDYSYIMAATGDRVPCVFVENGAVVNLDPEDPIYVSYKQNFPREPTGKKDPDLLVMHPSHGHNQSIVNVYSRLACLRMLKLAFHIICLSVFDELRTGLLEPEVHFIFHTNSAKVHHPFKITRAGFVTGFSPCNYLFNPFANSIST